MSALTTLRQLSGLPAAPAALSESALIIVDAQNTYRTGVMALEGVEAALDQCKLLLERARQAGIPVIHIQHDAGEGSPYDISAEIGAIADKVAPISGEPVIVKHYPSSFVQTDLHEQLQKIGVKNLIISGFMTHMCINSTARGAFSLGYSVLVAADTTATRALPAIDGAAVSAADVQRSALAMLGDLFAVVVPRQADIPD
ncbi:cysteine hydrolase family protein [Pseudomonas sp. TTU2014-080ASC]|uniref:cysteine hydrolase family protein n=1 Tax=Pseudomonas sp. TTU2014-080ASC TaxID=1729724 RepID=UPI000718AA1E|nr:cysteine hydrolase family protein [Pseudomonas sp. TTU2014-080ASC]KRW59924.1 isochorismatase [Pseudomonas sp. TTU2014-080ASC]